MTADSAVRSRKVVSPAKGLGLNSFRRTDPPGRADFGTDPFYGWRVHPPLRGGEYLPHFSAIHLHPDRPPLQFKLMKGRPRAQQTWARRGNDEVPTRRCNSANTHRNTIYLISWMRN